MRASTPRQMELLRQIFTFLAQHNIRVWVEWLASEMNSLADALSRLDMKRFHELLAQWDGAERGPAWHKRQPLLWSFLPQKAVQIRLATYPALVGAPPPPLSRRR